MNRKLCLVFAIGAAIALDARLLPPPVVPAWAACEKGTKLDKTTAVETRAKLAKAGYTKVRDLRKGCDNTWHAKAMKAGGEEFVAVLADGKVVKEGD
jgi:hypothetical protein